ERLHDGRRHGADGEQRAAHAGGKGRGCGHGGHSRIPYRADFFVSSASESDGLNSDPISLPSDRLRPVSISTLTLMPARRSLVSWSGSNTIRTGTRCTTFTQFPLAFCGGRMANWAPVPGLTAATVPWKAWPGKES